MAAGREKFLRVAEAKPADAGRGIVRIDPEVMKILELKEGDIVLIEGAKSTAAGVRRGYPEDANRGVIRMDGMQRRNAGVGIDDKVGLRKAVARPAEKVSLAPTEPIRIMGGEQYMAQVLQGRAITRGDVISVSVMGRKFDFVVTSFSPGADAVLVEAETEVKIAEKPIKEEEAKVPKVDYEDIGGLGSEVRKVRERGLVARSSGDGQDAPRESRRVRDERELPFDLGAGDHVQVLRTERREPAGHFQKG